MSNARQVKDAKRAVSLPISLLRAFEDLVWFILYSAHTVSLIKAKVNLGIRSARDFDELDIRLSSPVTHDSDDGIDIHRYQEALRSIGSRAESSLATATNDIISMIRSRSAPKSTGYIAIGPHYLAHAIMSNVLVNTRMLGESNMVDAYQKFVSEQVSLTNQTGTGNRSQAHTKSVSSTSRYIVKRRNEGLLANYNSSKWRSGRAWPSVHNSKRSWSNSSGQSIQRRTVSAPLGNTISTKEW